jgi:dinuclear metal center YbgI/SA1388 family protein
VLTVGDVLAGLERYAPAAKAAGWDPVGLQVGDPRRPVGTAGVCHEVTEQVVGALNADPVDLLVSYHPLLFEATTRFVAGRNPGGRALWLAELGVALAVVHTNADVAEGGSADALADALGLEDPAGFGPVWGGNSIKVTTFVPEAHADRVAGAMAAAGAGTIGDYTGCSFRVPGTGTFRAAQHASPAVGRAGAVNAANETRLEMVAPAARREAVVAALVHAHPNEEPAFDIVERLGDAGFAGRVGTMPASTTVGTVTRRVLDRLGGMVRVAGESSHPVGRLAVVPGSGAGLIREAADAGADAIVTGDIGHHSARAALDRRMAVIDPGHAATERPGVARLYAAVAALVPNTRDLSTADADPWRAP